MRYAEWQFEGDFRSAIHIPSDTAARFTRSERLLLRALIANAGQVLTREQLLDAVSGAGSEATDRGIDFLINRLRRKLGDYARSPRYIATRYGEGYAWIARRVPDASVASGAFIAVGPLRAGFRCGGWEAEAAAHFADQLVRELDRRTVTANRVVLDRDCPGPGEFRGKPPCYALGLHFLISHNGHLDCVLTLRDFPRSRVLLTERMTVADPLGRAEDASNIRNIGQRLTDALWLNMNYCRAYTPAADDEPLALRLQATAAELARDHDASWCEAERRLREHLGERPDDPEARIMLATTLHTKYVLAGPQVLAQGDPRAADEAEMTALVESALPQVQGSDLFVLAAARILHFACPPARARAVRLAEEVFENGTALAAAYATLGELRQWQGDLDESVALLDRALEMARPGTDFRGFLLRLKCRALVASGAHRAAATTATACYLEDPCARGLMPLFYASDAELELGAELEAMLEQLKPQLARAILRSHHYLEVRLLPEVRQRRRLMTRPAGILLERFGGGIIPNAIRDDVAAGESRQPDQPGRW